MYNQENYDGKTEEEVAIDFDKKQESEEAKGDEQRLDEAFKISMDKDYYYDEESKEIKST